MTEGTCNRGLQVVRLGRNERPEGYIIRPTSFAYCFIDPTGNAHASSMDAHGHGWSRDTALARAWAHFEAANDPPAIHTFQARILGVWRVGVGDDPLPGSWASKADARTAAWAWYWARAELARRMEALTDPRYREQAAEVWPYVLGWSDERVAQVEKDLAEVEAAVGEKPVGAVKSGGLAAELEEKADEMDAFADGDPDAAIATEAADLMRAAAAMLRGYKGAEGA